MDALEKQDVSVDNHLPLNSPDKFDQRIRAEPHLLNTKPELFRPDYLYDAVHRGSAPS